MSSQPTPNDANGQRYGLLCRALQAHPDPSDPLANVQGQLDQLDAFIHRELLALARQASPDDFADVYLDFTRELSRFREFAAYPHLATKTVVALGGAFSAGKSSLINSLLGKPLMVVEVDPTTALPAYVLAGEEDAIYALNTHRIRIALSDEEFASLTHDEARLHGSEVSRALSAAFVVRRDFRWRNLAFIDTPGYSGQSRPGGRTDASIAAAQLNSAHALIWVVNIKQGVMPETDLDFLAKVDPAIPKLVLVTRADQVNEADRDAIVARIAATLAERNLAVVGVFAVSAHPRHKASLEPIAAQLEQWNQQAQAQTFARRFKALFVRYQRGLEAERQQVHWERNRLNRLALLADSELTPLVEELASRNHEHNHRLETVAEELASLRTRFFAQLKQVGNQVGIALPEPHEVELLGNGQSHLLEKLAALRQKQGDAEPDAHQALACLRQSGVASQRLQLLRRAGRMDTHALTALLQPGKAAHKQHLLRRPPHNYHNIFANL